MLITVQTLVKKHLSPLQYLPVLLSVSHHTQRRMSRVAQVLLVSMPTNNSFCQSGAWAGQAKMNILTVNGASSCTNSGAMIAACPADTFVISGSYQLTAWGRNSSHNSPDAMYVDPVNNRFVVNAPTNNDTTCFRAIATCARFQ